MQMVVGTLLGQTIHNANIFFNKLEIFLKNHIRKTLVKNCRVIFNFSGKNIGGKRV